MRVYRTYDGEPTEARYEAMREAVDDRLAAELAALKRELSMLQKLVREPLRPETLAAYERVTQQTE